MAPVQPGGGLGVVNVQLSPWGSRERTPCVLSLGVAPASWLDWQRQEKGAPFPKAVPSPSVSTAPGCTRPIRDLLARFPASGPWAPRT